MLLSDLKLFLDTNNVSDDTRLTFISASTDNPVTDCYLVENLILLTYGRKRQKQIIAGRDDRRWIFGR